MHELSLAMSVREIVEEAAKKNGSVKVNEVNLSVGEFSSVSKDALEFAMNVVKKGTVFENARINIKSVKTIFLCDDCREETEMGGHIFKCGVCGSAAVRIIKGDRMYVESIDVEQGE